VLYKTKTIVLYFRLMDALIKIIEMHNGSKTALANHLQELRPRKKITQAHINNWLNRDGNVPPRWIIPLCESCEYKFRPHEFDAELYPNELDGLPEQFRHAA
jgi:hypothetical protein